MITKEQLEKFKELYLKRFGEEISDEDALEKTTRLLGLVELVYKPLKRKQDYM